MTICSVDNLSGTGIGEIDDHVISLTSKKPSAVNGQGLGQPATFKVVGNVKVSINLRFDFLPDDLLFFSLNRRFFKAESKSWFERNGRTLGPIFLAASVVVVVVELADCSSA